MKKFLKEFLKQLGLYEVEVITETVTETVEKEVIKEKLVKEYVLLPRNRWTQDDAVAFTAFLISPIGMKFQAVLQESSALANQQAALSVCDYEHACGFAAGYMALSRSILELQNFREKPIHEDPAYGTDAYHRERLKS